LKYKGTMSFHIFFRNQFWWAHLDLNQGPTRYERAALTN
jgi:hypothetical protein